MVTEKEMCSYCGLQEAVPNLIVAHACRSCCRTEWRRILVGVGRPDPGPHRRKDK